MLSHDIEAGSADVIDKEPAPRQVRIIDVEANLSCRCSGTVDVKNNVR